MKDSPKEFMSKDSYKKLTVKLEELKSCTDIAFVALGWNAEGEQKVGFTFVHGLNPIEVMGVASIVKESVINASKNNRDFDTFIKELIKKEHKKL